MTAKKSNPKKAASKNGKSTMTKIAETIGEVAGEISVKKEQFTDMASNAIKAVKSKIHDATAPNSKAAIKVVRKAEPKKAIKVVRKKVDKKVVQPVAKKAAVAKKAVDKNVINGPRTAGTAKKQTIKAAKKVSGKNNQ